MIERTLTLKIIALAQKFQVITLTGPRQSGKTTLVRAAFPSLPYVSLEEPDIRQIALTDPRGFLLKFKTHPTCFPTSKKLWMRTVRFNSS